MNNIIIGADLVPTKSNTDLFKKGDIKTLIGEQLYELWHEASARVFNLETPICDKTSPIEKCGPNLIAPASAFNGIKALNPDIVCLSNNHIMDQAEQGLNSTIKLLKDNKINYIGAGNNLKEANNYQILNINNKKVCFYGVCEHEFSVATNKKAGANPFDCLETPDFIQYLKGLCDYVIVLYHGGREHYRYPTPNLQKVCRKLANKGADIIIVQHTHCIGAYEKYKDATIVYGQGNFIFDYTDLKEWQTSLLLDIEIREERLIVNYIPIIKTDNTIKKADKEKADIIINDFYKRSEEITKKEFIENNFNLYCKGQQLSYLMNLKKPATLIRKIDNKIFKGKLTKSYYNKKRKLMLYNYTICEAHREILEKILKD